MILRTFLFCATLIVSFGHTINAATFFQATDMRFGSGGWGAVPGGAAGEAYFERQTPGFNVRASHDYFTSVGSTSAVAFGGTATTSTILDTRNHLVNDSSPFSMDRGNIADFSVVRRYGAINSNSTYTPGMSVGSLSDISFEYSLRSVTQTGGVAGAAMDDNAAIATPLVQSSTIRHGFYILATQDGSLYEALVFGISRFRTEAHDDSHSIDASFDSLTFNKVGTSGTGGATIDINGSEIQFGYGVEFNTNLEEGENESSIAEVSNFTIESVALVPEPSSFLFLLVGGLGLLGRRTRK